MKLVHANAAGLLLTVMLLGASVTARTQASAEANDARTYGTAAKTFMALTPANFVPLNSAVTVQIGFSGGVVLLFRTNTAGFGVLLAPLHLPEGSLVTEMEAVFFDGSASSHFEAALVIQPRNARNTYIQGPSSTDAEAPGVVDRTVAFTPPVQIDNNTNAYFVQITLTASNSDTQFRSLRVGYMLQVSPAPTVARFNDVPTNHLFFQFIEALAAAGITGGCSITPPLYCPDDPVTRGQMAVFLSRALGLQFAP